MTRSQRNAFGAARSELPEAEFYKTYVKRAGTGHRKNRHLQGVCRVLVRQSSNAWHRTMAWIDALDVAFNAISPSVRLPAGSLAQSGRATDS